MWESSRENVSAELTYQYDKAAFTLEDQNTADTFSLIFFFLWCWGLKSGILHARSEASSKANPL
jgi:hypothetical protein